MSARERLLVGLAVGVLWPWTGYAAGDPAKDVALEIKRITATIKNVRANPSLDQDDSLARTIAFASRGQLFFLVYAVLREQWGVPVTPADVAAAAEPNLAAVEQARTDVQAGATASSSGSSSLVSKGSAPSYFGVAVENGAFSKNASATTTTFQGNLVGVLDTLGSTGYLASFTDDAPFTRFLRRISFTFTLKNSSPETETAPDSSAGAAPQGVTETVRRQLEQFDRRLEQYAVRSIVGRDRRDPRGEDNASALQKLMTTPAQAVLAAAEDALGMLQVSNEYDRWVSDSVQALKAAPLAFLDGVLISRLNELSDLAKRQNPDFQTRALAVYQAYAAFSSARSTVLENIERRPVFAVEYVNARQTLQPDLSTYRFIGEGQKGRWDLTVNAAYTAYNHQPAGGGPRFRDFQFAAGADRPLGNRQLRGQPNSPIGNAVFAVGFLFERLSESATVTFGGRNLVAPPGNLYIGQVRVTIPMNNAGVKLPLSVSVSNRTELLDEKQIRANLGFTFNFDAVASLLKK